MMECEYKPGECVCTTMQDDSMAPKLLPGDKLLIHLQNTIESGQIGIVTVNGQGYIGSIEVAEDHITLSFNNPQYPSKRFERHGKNPVRIYGRVFEMTRDLSNY